MAFEEDCYDDDCRVDPEYSALIVWPCGTVPWAVSDGKLRPMITDELIAAGRKLKICGTLNYTPNVTESETACVGGCGARDCFVKFNGYTMGGPIQYCPKDCFIEAITHPTKSYTFDFAYFIHPENCGAPTATDVMQVGVLKSVPQPREYVPDTDTGLRVNVQFRGCHRPLCQLNDCCDMGLDVTSTLNQCDDCDEINEAANAALQAA